MNPPTRSVDPMTIDPATATALRNAGAKVEEWTEKRNELIRRAVLEEGGAIRTVGELVGLSHTAVRHIAHGRYSDR